MATAYSYELYPGDGVTDVFSIPFEYLLKDHITVSVDGVSVDFTWVNDYAVQPDEVPADGTVVEVRRTTPVDERVTDYQDGSTLEERDLDRQTSQLLYIVQEAYDAFVGAMGKNTTGNFDAQGLTINDLADPEVDTDAATKGYVDTQFDADKAAITALKVAAENAQTGAETAQGLAEDAADDAAASAALAGTHATNAGLSEANALTYRNQAEQFASSMGRFEVKEITSDYTVPSSENGYLFVVDTTGGPVSIALPSIATVGEPFTCRIKKVDGSNNAISVVPNGTDTIDGVNTPHPLTIEGAGALFSSDLDPSPDNWATAAFGSSTKITKRDYLFTLTEGQTVVSGEDDNSSTLGYVNGNLDVILNGVVLIPGVDYTSGDGATLTLVEAASAGDELFIRAWASFDVADTYSKAEIEQLIENVPTVSAYRPQTLVSGPDVLVAPGGTQYAEEFTEGAVLSTNEVRANSYHTAAEQQFIAPHTGLIVAVDEVFENTSGSYPGTITMTVHPNNESNRPDLGVTLGTTSVTSWPARPSHTQFTFDPPVYVTQGEKYWLRWSYPEGLQCSATGTVPAAFPLCLTNYTPNEGTRYETARAYFTTLYMDRAEVPVEQVDGQDVPAGSVAVRSPITTCQHVGDGELGLIALTEDAAVELTKDVGVLRDGKHYIAITGLGTVEAFHEDDLPTYDPAAFTWSDSVPRHIIAVVDVVDGLALWSGVQQATTGVSTSMEPSDTSLPNPYIYLPIVAQQDSTIRAVDANEITGVSTSGGSVVVRRID